MTDQPKKTYDLESAPFGVEANSAAEGAAPYLAMSQIAEAARQGTLASEEGGDVGDKRPAPEVATEERPPLLGRLLARGEQLATMLPSPPEGLWEVGSDVHLQVVLDEEEPLALEWGAGTIDEEWDGLDEEGGAPRKELFPWWMRPLWGLGIVALVGMVFWRLPPDTAQPNPGTRPVQGRASTPRRHSPKRAVVPPVRVRVAPQPRLFPAHPNIGRLRPKGLPLDRTSPRALASHKARRAPGPMATTSTLHFSLFARRGKRIWEVRDGQRWVGVRAPRELRTNDELRFGYQRNGVLPTTTYVTLVVVDAGGQISPIYPSTDGKPVLLRAGKLYKRQWLPDGAVLDDSPLAERAFVCITKRPLALATLQGVVRKALKPRGGAQKLYALVSLPLGCLHQQSWWLHKVGLGVTFGTSSNVPSRLAAPRVVQQRPRMVRRPTTRDPVVRNVLPRRASSRPGVRPSPPSRPAPPPKGQ